MNGRDNEHCGFEESKTDAVLVGGVGIHHYAPTPVGGTDGTDGYNGSNEYRKGTSPYA